MTLIMLHVFRLFISNENGKLITEGTPEEVITKECMKNI